MRIGSVTANNSMSYVQITKARSTDVKSKNLQNKIKEAQQQMQNVSAKEDLSVDEKANERKTQQKELSDLNAELKQHQEELRRSQRRDMMLAELQKDEKPAEEGKTTERGQDSNASEEEHSFAASSGMQGTVLVKNSDGTVILKGEANADKNRSADADKKKADETEKSGTAEKETKSVKDDADTDKDKGLSLISEDASVQQTKVRGAVISRLREGIVVLKGEINQDEMRGVNTDQKQKELKKLEEQEERAKTFPFSDSRTKNDAMNPMASAKVSGIQDKTDNDTVVSFSTLSKERDQEAAQQRFHVSFVS